MPPDLSFADWASAGRKLARIADATCWCLGDWLAHGQTRFRGRYQRAAEEVGLNSQTLRNYAWLARKFSHDRRRPALSLQHHAEVAPLPVPEQDHWLRLAEERSWSRNELRRRIRTTRTAGTPGKPAPDSAARPGRLPPLPVTVEEVTRWHSAAEQRATDLSTWMVQTLNDAARNAAGPAVGH
ncbi:LmbU family transcriptional regulator [Streptomyces sp. NPDC048420]|uniref:LmbU family transcriptional regulator n=1 Tax=Streptomyces sp. NPDC048420 TaxID=3155755 RepID=UPI00341B0D6A